MNKARKLKVESSSAGLKGIHKKLGYWVMIGVAFIMSSVGCGYNVPALLIKGLAVIEKLINAKMDTKEEED